MIEKLGEGTFGYPSLPQLSNGSEVWKARVHGSSQLYALKKILMHNEKEGVLVPPTRQRSDNSSP